MLGGCASVDPGDQTRAPLRVIRARVAADTALRHRSGWEAMLRRLFADVSAVWEREFGIRWEVAEIVPWKSPPTVDADVLNNDLRVSVGPGDADVLVGFSGRRCPGIRHGVAGVFGAEAFVNVSCADMLPAPFLPQFPPTIDVLSHELAHLFGMFHPARGPSVMRGGAAHEFDRYTKRVIRLMRGFDFRRGVEGIDEATRAAWLEIFHAGAARDEPNDLALALRNRGARLAEAGQYERGEALLHEALRIWPEFAAPHIDLGVLYGSRGEHERAIAEFEAALRIDPLAVSAMYGLGNAFTRLGRLDDAIREYEDAARLAPGYAHARYGLATVLARRGTLDQALPQFMIAAALAPDDAQMRRGLGNAQLSLGRVDDAVRTLREAVRLDPTSVEARTQLGTALGMRGDLRESITVLRAAVRLKPDSALAIGNLGYSLARSGDLEGALAAYREALRLDPGADGTRVNLANALSMLGRLDAAARELSAGIAGRPSDSLLMARGRIRLAQRRLQEAVVDLGEAVRLNPRNGDAQYQLAIAHSGLGHTREAREAVESARALGVQVPASLLDRLGVPQP